MYVRVRTHVSVCAQVCISVRFLLVYNLEYSCSYLQGSPACWLMVSIHLHTLCMM